MGIVGLKVMALLFMSMLVVPHMDHFHHLLMQKENFVVGVHNVY